MANDGKYQIGMVGLGVMGRNLALNMGDHDFAVVGYDKDQQMVRQLNANVGVGNSQAVGVNTSGSFYLDVSALSQINQNTVLNLLSATSVALQKVGQPANIRAAMSVAHEILSE